MKFRYLAAVSLIAMTVSGCTSTSSVMPSPDAVDSPKEAPLRVDVNPGYKAGTVDYKIEKTADLGDILAKESVKKKKNEEPKEGIDRLRDPAMIETATAYGVRAGLAHETAQINKRMQANSAMLTKSYNFQALMILGPNGSMITPPVISEAVDPWETFDGGKTLRVADTVYEIIDQSRFAPVAPMWQTYLITSFDEAPKPPEALLPQDDRELATWNKAIKQGWDKGREQAHDIYQANLDRLNRDFEGMVRFKKLLEEKKVSAPLVAVAPLGTTGTGQDMRVGDVGIRITQDPTLQVAPKKWDASATTTNAAGEPVGPEKVSPPPAETRPAPKPRPTKPRTYTSRKPVKVEAKDPKPVEKTSGGDGRF
jgi:defect-in-organelle-trafficking protein DotC